MYHFCVQSPPGVTWRSFDSGGHGVLRRGVAGGALLGHPSRGHHSSRVSVISSQTRVAPRGRPGQGFMDLYSLWARYQRWQAHISHYTQDCFHPPPICSVWAIASKWITTGKKIYKPSTDLRAWLWFWWSGESIGALDGSLPPPSGTLSTLHSEGSFPCHWFLIVNFCLVCSLSLLSLLFYVKLLHFSLILDSPNFQIKNIYF